MTVRQALARAGGPTLAGSTRNVTIFRDGEKLKKVDLDGELKAEDSVFINEKWL
jgi:polysaccharide export outer membrane protein